MNTILTDDERREVIRSTPLPRGEDGIEAVSKAIEAAVLAKLREQEPADYQILILGKRWTHCAKHIYDASQDRSIVRALYAAPLPAVVQVPPGYKLVPVEPTPEMNHAGRYGGDEGAPPIGSRPAVEETVWPFCSPLVAAKIYRAMLAAAPEAPAQSDPLEKLTRIQEELSLYDDKPAQADMGNPISVPAPWREAVKVAREATEEDAYEMGATGAPATEQERKLFEAWMRGHCWALRAHWNGSSYVSDAEQGGDLDPRAMVTRQLWAAWRDRAALAQLDALEGGE